MMHEPTPPASADRATELAQRADDWDWLAEVWREAMRPDPTPAPAQGRD